MDKKIELIVIDISNSQEQASAYALVLEDVEKKRQLPIIIGAPEAQAISLAMKKLVPPRPLTHDLFANCLMQMGAFLSEILIYQATDGVFYSYIYLEQDGKKMQIDSRTSDAIALALRFRCPIYIYESILNRECVKIQEGEAANEDDFLDETLAPDDLPLSIQIKSKSLGTLKKDLAKAIEEENYELASIIRDEIENRK